MEIVTRGLPTYNASMISVAEALEILARTVQRTESEDVPIGEAWGRVLARDLVCDVDWPPFDTSAMDGYAVRLEDASRPDAQLAERPGIVAAGESSAGALSPGEAARVMTGAPLPSGTEAVIPVERSRRQEGRVRFEIAPVPGAHIRRRGESIAAGEKLLEAGRRLSAGDIALAALAGADPVAVFRRPRVSIAVTGNELVAPAQKPRAGQLRDSNGPMLLALCRAAGREASLKPRVADERSGVERLFAGAGSDEDLLVTSGGVSAGDLDLLPEIARAGGFEVLFHGVSVRPGKPIILARRGRVLWIGLPGNPVSSSVGFHVFVRYALDLFEGDAAAGAPRATARTVAALRAGGPREAYLDAVFSNAGGENRVEALRSSGSHDIAAHARANALIRLPAGSPALPAGSVVECLRI